MRRWGVAAGLALFPLGMALGAVIALLTGGALWAVALTIASVPVLLRTINDAAVNVLYLPVPSALRQRAKPLMDMLSAVSFGLAGVVFLLLQQVPSWTYIHWSLPILALAGIWIALLPWVRRHYVGALAEGISRRRLDVESGALDMADETTVLVLLEALYSDDDLLAAHTLNLLAKAPGRVWEPHIAPLLAHSSPAIRLLAVQYLGRPEYAAHVEEVAVLLRDVDSTVRAAAIRTHCTIAGADGLGRIEPFLEASDPLVRGAALAGLLSYGGPEGRRRADGHLYALLASADPVERIEGARALTALTASQPTGPTAYDPGVSASLYESLLTPLMDDPDRTVRRHAIQAAGALRLHGLLSRILAHLGEETAAEALEAFGGDALPALRDTLADQGRDRAIRALIPPIVQRIGGTAAAAMLLDRLAEPDALVRSSICRALARLGATAGGVPSPDDTALEARVILELQDYYALAAVRADLGEIAGDALLRAILGERQQQALDRVFSLLEFRYPGRRLEHMRRALSAETPETRAVALELLDTVLDRTIAGLLIQLIEAPEEQIVQTARRRFSLTARTPWEQLANLATAADPWMRAAAILRIGTQPAPDLRETAVAALTAEDPVVCEAALAACRRLVESSQLLPAVRAQAVDSPFALVRRYARGLMEDWHAGRSPMLSTVERVLFLKVADIFSAVASEDLVPVAMIAQEVHFATGEAFIRQGDQDDCLYAIVDGDVGIVVRDVGQVAIRRSRSIVGEMALLSSRPRSTDCVALTEITALRIDRADFWELLAERPSLALGVITVLTQRLDEAVQNLSRSSDL